MFKSKKLFWLIFPGNILTILLAIVFVSWYSAASFREFHLQVTETDLEARARLLSSKINDYLLADKIKELRDYCVQAGRESRTRITVILENGKVVADSNENPDIMDNHRQRVEIAKAFSGKVGISRRYSKTLGENLLYVAIPLENSMRQPLGESQAAAGAVLRTSVSVAILDEILADTKIRIGYVALAVMVIAGFVTLLISRNVSKPLEQMTKNAEHFSRGDFSDRMMPVARKTASFEVMALASSMDRMAELLDEKIQTIVTQKNQLETVFSSMVEAVVAIDNEERVISMNSAAAELFGIEKQAAPAMIVQQVVRNVNLQQQISHTLTTQEPVEDEIVFFDKTGERFLQTNIVTLVNGMGEYTGVLVVMNDVTRLRRLENIRSDFVANVSHELRTPITSIRGYVETLLDGALDNREDAIRFLQIVLRQSNRLSNIIDDLLVLSRIEEESKQGQIYLEKGLLCPVIESAAQACQLKADAAGVTLTIDCPADIAIEMNSTLMEQALVNLLMNGITYSKQGGEVAVQASVNSEPGYTGVRIAVRDNGCGIARRHLPRLFERFYRSDKARSRALGGTGLGLAIVKHIVQAHRGTIAVTSAEGIGSEFAITIKRQNEAKLS